jgi:hypothetical protein
MTAARDDVASELIAFGRFLGGLPRLVRRRMSVSEAVAIVQERLRNRERNFITVLEHGIFANPRSPYRTLLGSVGCTLDDVRELLAREGLDGTLLRLRGQGVYVSFEEFKGTTPIVRGSLTLHTTPADFDNPGAVRFYSTTTGGSTGAGRRVQLDLEHLEALLPGRIVVRHVQGITGVPAASWSDLPPGGGLKGVLLHAAAGEEATHWFSARPISGRGVPLRFRLATHAALGVARAAGASVSWPRYLPFEEAATLARWAHDQVRRHGACTIHASVSRILRIAVSARAGGIDLTGTVLRGGGEPPTPAKVSQITSAGATFRSSYAFSEVGTVGSSCLHADGPNDQHFMQDHLAMIQASRTVPRCLRSASPACSPAHRSCCSTWNRTTTARWTSVHAAARGRASASVATSATSGASASSPEKASRSWGATWSASSTSFSRHGSAAARSTTSSPRRRTSAASRA